LKYENGRYEKNNKFIKKEGWKRKDACKKKK